MCGLLLVFLSSAQKRPLGFIAVSAAAAQPPAHRCGSSGRGAPSALPPPAGGWHRCLSEAGPERNCTCERNIALCDSVTHFINTVVPFGVLLHHLPSLPAVLGHTRRLRLGKSGFLMGWTLPRVTGRAGPGLEACPWSPLAERGLGAGSLCVSMYVHMCVCVCTCVPTGCKRAPHMYMHIMHMNLWV